MIRTVSTFSVLAAFLSACGHTGASTTFYDTNKHLVLDSRIIASQRNIRLVLGEVQKDPHNPLFGEEKPWEVRFDNLYPNVIFDEEDRIFKCWYNPFIIDELASNTPREQRASVPYKSTKREMGVCYAISKDGIVWEKPELGVIEFNGSTHNNIVMRHVHGVGVWKDLHDPDPSRRYKALMSDGAATSPDGLHWSIYKCPGIQAAGDTHNNAFWDERSEMYIGITRLWEAGQRIVGRTESRDYVNWTKAQEVLRAPADDRHRQTYANIVFPYADIYLGLLMVFNTAENVVDCELAWSPDTIKWHRVCPGTPLIPRGLEGSYDCGCIYAAAYPVLRNGQLLLYYGGSNGPHSGWRDGFLCLARLRPDGFAGMEPEDASRAGTVTTQPLECMGSQLRVSADAAEGELRVTVLDSEGRAIRRSEPLSADVTDGLVTWRGGGDLGPLKGQQIRLRFRLKAAKLYAFGFAE